VSSIAAIRKYYIFAQQDLLILDLFQEGLERISRVQAWPCSCPAAGLAAQPPRDPLSSVAACGSLHLAAREKQPCPPACGRLMAWLGDAALAFDIGRLVGCRQRRNTVTALFAINEMTQSAQTRWSKSVGAAAFRPCPGSSARVR
jgi:hypothetical protein